ncbi:MAG: Asp-tRNA(Asn)/Glu-tRNA(Gln) amidotransferase subunit GatB [Bacteroidota bacterium]
MAGQETRYDSYQTVIGLEIHVQLATQSKIFATEAVSFAVAPNHQVSAITMAHPGALPFINGDCIRLAVTMGLATNCQIRRQSYFARKNYFYPDLPKGYQLSQDDQPICYEGLVQVPMPDGSLLEVRLERIHLEEDAGKSIHDQSPEYTQIDLNRAGTGLIEMVTFPDLRSAEEAGALMAEVRRLVRYLGVSDGNMQEGSLRCDANVSVMPKGSETLGTRVEIKNINSISQVIRAIQYESKRQVDCIEAGQTIYQETRTWNVDRQQSQPMRHKETADDYRYFPEPDLQPVHVSESLIQELKVQQPELPYQRFLRYSGTYQFPLNEATALIEQREFSEYFEGLSQALDSPKTAANWVLGPIRSYLNEQGIDITAFPVPIEQIQKLIQLVENGAISHSAAREQLFPALLEHPSQDPEDLAKAMDLLMTSLGDELAAEMTKLIEAHPKEVKRYQAGKKQLASFFVGQLMKAFKGKANPKEVNQVVREMLA